MRGTTRICPWALFSNCLLTSTVSRELENINEWFISNKLSLNVKKRKISGRDDLPLVLPKLFINPFSTGIIEKLDFWDANNSTNVKHQ